MIKNTVCPLDCPDTCSLDVTVEDQQITKIRGSRTNPYTDGVICEKVAKYYPDFVHGEQRLREPLRRTGEKGGNEFEVISWDDALSLITERTQEFIDRYGAESVLPLNYAGPHGQLGGGSMDRRFFNRLGATQLDRGPLCGAVRGTAYTSLFGNSPGMPPEQAEDADVIVVWGNNVTVSNLHFARVIKKAREKGATLIVIDPKKTRIAEQAHHYLQIAPGTDVVLALAVSAEIERRNKLNEEFVDLWVEGANQFLQQARRYTIADAARICGLSPDAIVRLADLYVGAKTLATSVGNGIERGKSGGSGLRAIMSINALLGQFGRRGAGVFAKPGFAFPYTSDKLQRPDLIPQGTRTLNIVDIGRHLLTDDIAPPLRSVFIFNHNPVATHPDQNRMIRALSRKELFITGIDVVMTDTMRYCDVVLPASSHFEYDDIYGSYGHSYLQRAEPVIPPVANSLPNTEIFRRMAKYFGMDDPMFSDDDQALMEAAVDATDSRLPGVPVSELPTDAALLMKANTTKEVMMCNTVLPKTASGKIELFSQDLEDKFGFGVPRYEPAVKDKPFTLISPSSSKRTNATFGSHEDSDGVEIVEIHPSDANEVGAEEGSLLKVTNSRGEVILKAKVTDGVRSGVLYSPKGTWLKTSSTGQTVNALIDADIKTDIMAGACYNETFVDISVLQN